MIDRVEMDKNWIKVSKASVAYMRGVEWSKFYVHLESVTTFIGK